VAVAEAIPAKVAEERAIILKTMDDHEKSIGAISKDVRATAADVKDITKELHSLLQESEGVLKAADSLAVKLAPDPKDPSKPSHPFDIREFTVTLDEALKALHEARGLLESPAWTARVEEVNRAAQTRVTHASGEAQRFVDVVFWRTAVLIVLIFVLMAAYRAIPRRTAPPPAKS